MHDLISIVRTSQNFVSLNGVVRSLLNLDYSILMKVLAESLQSVMNIIVGPQQTCDITNVSVTLSISVCCDTFVRRVAMLQANIEKNFDRASHEIIVSVIQHDSHGACLVQRRTHGVPKLRH